jgi:hypothetical protein
MNDTSQNTDASPHAATLPIVRAQVKDILTQSPAFRGLPEDKRRDLARDMVSVAHFIVGNSEANTPRAAALAGPIADPAGETAGQRFAAAGAGAAQQGAATYAELVQKVDFPKFVGGLIHGVFDAIVDASIRQMEAYAELVKNVAKSVDQYMKDNITENQARDFLADKYPDHLEVDISGTAPKLKPREGADDNNLPDFFSDLGLTSSVSSLDEDNVEQVLVPAARRRMAMDRQQLLATMVLMGINRLVVTDGRLEASVLFELDTKDEVKRKFKRTTDFGVDTFGSSESGGEGSRSSSGREGGFLWWGGKNVSEKSSWYNKNYSQAATNFKVSTTQSEDSTSKVDLHAKLAGKVNVNFKSETFPLDKMADVLQVKQIREKAPGQAGTSGAVPGAAPAQPAAAPAVATPAAGK